MNHDNSDRAHDLDELLDKVNTQTTDKKHYPNQIYGYSDTQHTSLQPYNARQKKNSVVKLLLLVILMVVVIVIIQILSPFGTSGNHMPNNNGNFFQQDVSSGDSDGLYFNEGPNNGPPNDGGSGNGPYFNEGPNNAPNGNQSGEGGGLFTRRGEDGKTEYSTDGGKTWSETPPKGYDSP